MSGQDRERLKLRARDARDYEVLSAVLQDALVPVSDMAHLARDKRFVFLATRFRWEARAALSDLPDQPRPDPPEAGPRAGDASFEDAPLYERIQCGVTIDRVANVRYRGFRRDDPDRILNLLAVIPDAEGVTLQFSGEAGLRLQGRRLVCHLEDLGEAWPTHWRPSHEVPDDATGDEAAGDGAGASPSEAADSRSEET
jgi:hypothetical protein